MFNLDSFEFEFPCPKCCFLNPLTYGEARLGAPIICRGCKITLLPYDAGGSVENARRDIMRVLSKLGGAITKLGW